MNHRTPLVYGVLLAVWGAIAGWQYIEHVRFTEAERLVLRNSAKEISQSLEVFIRSQQQWWFRPEQGGFVPADRLAPALQQLAKLPDKLKGVALLNAEGEVVLSEGAIDTDLKNLVGVGERWDWDARTVTVINLIDFGANVEREGSRPAPTIVLPPAPRREPGSDGPRPPRRPPDENTSTGNASGGTNRTLVSSVSTNSVTESVRGSNDDEGRGRPRPRPRFGRPPGMSEEDYRLMLEKRTLHGFALVLPTQVFLDKQSRDLWMRAFIVSLAGISVFGFGLAWRNQARSSEFQMRLVRASELNSHLKEMNIAAAGLAHETRNPLNIIRGVAHMISRLNDAPGEVKEKARVITDEVDRVTSQLNEFINYSRPRELRRAPVALNSVVSDVVRALDCDLEEKTIRLTVLGEELTIEADEQLLRQVLFNLLINSVQAVETGGHIQITSRKLNAHEAVLEVSDNGPGVSNEVRHEIFKPYFTTRKTGTGLGLAIVHQIVLAHGWTIECLANAPHGALFQISGLKLSHV